MSFQLKTIILVVTRNIFYIYFKIETKIRLENRLLNHVKERIKDPPWRKNMTAGHKLPSFETLDTKPIELENSTDYEAMWDIVINNWARNWNYYSKELTTDVLNLL